MSEQDVPAMTSHRPYLLRALYAWIVDNAMTPHVLVDAGQPDVRVPQQAISDGKVVLNIAERAVTRLEMDNDWLSFTARFGGVSHPVQVPMAAILAIYARETGHGMVLPDDVGGPGPDPDDDPAPPQDDGPDDGSPSRRGGHLRVVK